MAVCDCIRLTNEALAKENEQLRTMFFFDGQGPRLYVKTTPLERKRGQKDRKLLLTFCPFCGERVIAEEAPSLRSGAMS